MPLINYKIELKFRWRKHVVLSVVGAANGDNDDDAKSC